MARLLADAEAVNPPPDTVAVISTNGLPTETFLRSTRMVAMGDEMLAVR